MLNLNIQLGRNPIHKHKPIFCKSYPQFDIPFKLTVGEDGQIVAWSIQSLKPVYYMIASLNGDHGKCISFIVTPLRIVNQQEKTYKIITYHKDGRVRIWQLVDGTCINISSLNLFKQNIVGIIENPFQCRFFFPFSDNTIFIVDSWTMKLVGQLQPKRQVYSQYIKGQINEKKEIQLYDNYHKSYKLVIGSLFSQSYNDVGKSINSLRKAQLQIDQEIQKLHDAKLVLIHKVWKADESRQMLKDIIESQTQLEKQRKLSSNIFNPKFIENFSSEDNRNLESLLPKPQQISYENIFFIKGVELWYFLGTADGRILGFPAVKKKAQAYYMVLDEKKSSKAHLVQQQPQQSSRVSSGEKQNGKQADKKDCALSEVKYLNLVDNLLVASWDDGTFKVFSADNMNYMLRVNEIKQIHQSTIEEGLRKKSSLASSQAKSQQMKQRVHPQGESAERQKVQSENDPKLFEFQNRLRTFDLNQLKSFEQKLSAPVKYTLSIYQISNQEGKSQKLTSHESAFQLQNNEVVVYDSLHHRITHYVGVKQGVKIYSVLNLHGTNEYVGIATEENIQIYGPSGFQRVISYGKQWQWQDFNIFQPCEVKEDYNFFNQDRSTGLELIEFANRHFTRQIQYTCSLDDVYYETFGNIDTNSFPNEIYSKFHFLDKIEVQKSLHSRCIDAYLAILKHKHNSYRRAIASNTSFILNANLNKELEIFSNGTESLENAIQQNFSMFSCFLWDVYDIPHLSNLMHNSKQQFTLKRRHVHQGIGKTFTLYFDPESIFNLSKFILTEYAISTISFFQAYAMKDSNDKADQMVEAVEYFTLTKETEQIFISGETLSKSVISKNQNIVKASINLLISTIIAGHLDIHPLYEYFILNLKNIQENKEKFISKTQCSWLLYLGLGIMYGKQPVEKQQVKMLIGRILDCIDLNNFVKAPDLILVILKLFNEGLNWWKNLFLTKQHAIKILLDLFKIFFYYDGVTHIALEDKKFNFCFENDSQQHIKKMKQAIIKTIFCLAKQFNPEFIQCLTSEAVNQKVHLAYPASVVEILRQYLKTEKPTQHLVFFVELLLQSLSPMTPNLRKFVQKNVIATLQLMCTYKSISFNQTSQKLSVKTAHHVYVYCLRTSTKWRTISLKQKGEQIKEDSILQMSPKGTYIALLSQKLYVWRLSSGFWSGVLGAFSQGWTFDAEGGTALAWEQNENSVTVVNPDPSNNKQFKL